MKRLFSHYTKDDLYAVHCMSADNGRTVHYVLTSITGGEVVTIETVAQTETVPFDFHDYLGLYHSGAMFLVVLSGNSFDGFEMIVVEGKRL